MTLKEYLQRKTELAENQWSHREICWTCRQPNFSCYCHWVKPVDVQIKFVILIHPIEVKRRIASGRMAHMCLQNSHLIEGHDYSNNQEINDLLRDPNYFPMVLYPGSKSKNLSNMTTPEIASLVPPQKKLLVFVIDGTWNTARKMIRLSQNIATLPRVCFDPRKPSNFRLRKQPHSKCLSTIEAIHECIEYLGFTQNFSIDERRHDHLLDVFTRMIDRQFEIIAESNRKLEI